MNFKNGDLYEVKLKILGLLGRRLILRKRRNEILKRSCLQCIFNIIGRVEK